MPAGVGKKEENQVYWMMVENQDDLDRLMTRLKGFAETADKQHKKMVIRIIFTTIS